MATSFAPTGKLNPERLENSAADSVFQRIVAEQPEVAGPAAGGYSRQNRNTQSGHAIAGARVQIGGTRGFQFGQTARRQGEPAEAVRNHKNNIGFRRFAQFANEIVCVHVEKFTHREE